ncbi:MAG TPA: hypothetical protein VKG85_10950 [Actinomycetes bacterium]|nr:hypothetical protein [Actinomycetes bacterium]
MSYDLRFVPHNPGQDWEETLAAAEESFGRDRPVGGDLADTWDRLVDRCRPLLDGPVELYLTREFRELSDEGTGITLTLFPTEAGLTAPYGHGEPKRLIATMFALAQVVQEETGWRGFDPQLGVGLDEVRAGVVETQYTTGPGGDDRSSMRFVQQWTTFGDVVEP